jgi:2-dehydropantoate 2-reductase
LQSPDGTYSMARDGLSAYARLDDALAAGTADLLVLAVKCYDTHQAVVDFEAVRSALPPVLTLQNGVGNEEALAGVIDPARLLAGAITFPVSLGQSPGTVVLERRRGGIGLAPVQAGAGTTAVWAASFTACGLPTRVYSDYRALKWSKLIMNLLANASAAILDRSSVDVMADPELFALEAAALREALDVMRALHVPVVGLPGYPVPLLALALRLAPRWLLHRVLGPMVGGSRGRKPPSLRLDLARGRSEVEWLNGAVVRGGAQAGVSTPVNRALAETLGRILAGEAPPGEDWRASLVASLP